VMAIEIEKLTERIEALKAARTRRLRRMAV